MTHERCFTTNEVLLIAANREQAELYSRTLPMTMSWHYVSSPKDTLGFCAEHVSFLLVGTWYQSSRANRMLELCEERGFKQGRNPNAA